MQRCLVIKLSYAHLALDRTTALRRAKKSGHCPLGQLLSLVVQTQSRVPGRLPYGANICCGLVVVASVLLGCSYWPAYAQCAVEPWSIPYLGSNTSTTMLAGSGQVCQIDPGVGGTNVITSVTISVPARNGSASVGAGDVVSYQSQSGFTGQDSFTFTLSGSGPGGSGSSAVQVSVTVQ